MRPHLKVQTAQRVSAVVERNVPLRVVRTQPPFHEHIAAEHAGKKSAFVLLFLKLYENNLRDLQRFEQHCRRPAPKHRHLGFLMSSTSGAFTSASRIFPVRPALMDL
jgi:hypothetical protein